MSHVVHLNIARYYMHMCMQKPFKKVKSDFFLYEYSIIDSVHV